MYSAGIGPRNPAAVRGEKTRLVIARRVERQLTPLSYCINATRTGPHAVNRMLPSAYGTV